MHNTQPNEEAQSSITAVCRNIIEFQARAACFLQRNPVESTIRNMFKWDGWDGILSAIKEAESKVKDCARRKSMNDVCKIYDKLSEINNDIVGGVGEGFSRLAETQEAIDRKTRVDAFLQLLYNNASSYKDSKNRNRERVTGTCDWFTDHALFKQWNLPVQSRLASSGLLYVTADPGCGKSVLSRYLIDQILPDDERTVCYFFFKDDFENQKTSLSALCTLLHQLFVSNRHLVTDAILEHHGAHGNKFVESFSELWKIFITAAGHQETVCVLDALDECMDTDRKQLINAMTDAQVNGLKFLVTSRPYEHVRRQISNRANDEMTSIHLQGDRGETAAAIVQEIQLVVECRIDEIAKSFRLLPDEHELMKQQLNSVPNRTYLWITLIFDGLMEKKSSITKQDIIALTKHLPQGINAAYQKILSKSEDVEKAKRLLHLILAARRPLSLSEMSVALAFDNQRSWNDVAEEIVSEDRIQDTIRNLCGLFVTVVDKRVYLIHQTAREFLVRDFAETKEAGSRNFKSLRTHNGTATDLIVQNFTYLLMIISSMVEPILHRIWLFMTRSWQQSMDLTHSNSVLAETCISYLHSSFAKENDSLLEYSAFYWPDHYLQAEKSCQEALGKMTQDLCMLSIRSLWTGIHAEHDRIPGLIGSSLCLAAALGLDRAVTMFLHEHNCPGRESENDIDLKDDCGQTPLSWAARKGHDSVVMLLEATGKADIDSKDNSGQTPLSWAAENGHDAVVRLLIATGNVDVNWKDKDFGQTPLSWAAENGHEPVVKLLIATGKADINSKDNFGQTPLSYAARNGYEAVVGLLEATGKADVDTKDSSGQTPLICAAENGHDGAVRLLIATGKSDIDSKDNTGQTPLSYAARNGHEAVVRLLVATGKAEIDSKDNSGQTPLSWAAENGHDAVVGLLIATGKVDVDSKDKDFGQTPLSWAAQNGHDAVVRLLIATGKADVNSRDNFGETPLSWAAENGHEAVVKLLVATGEADVDSKHSSVQTPLSWAVEYGHDAMVKLLVAMGHFDIKEKNGRKPLYIQDHLGHVLASYLESSAEWIGNRTVWRNEY
jgi:ankyrin repeat protein